ncbi:MAG: hypothetical protein EXS55_00190 [Candidatus Magasanikbacteria bacterium]|nr:hypothetical protein [Candidatus Magasanikbacteria bacterium]
MRALLLHTNRFESRLVEPSSRPVAIEPEDPSGSNGKMTQCLSVLFCAEKDDATKQLVDLYHEILKTAEELGVQNILISPFVHLSSSIASPAKAKALYEQLLKKMAETHFAVASSHFGYHKSLLLDIKGHPGAFRYREFY